jgi:hypothetical protein
MGRHPEVFHDAFFRARQNAQRALPADAHSAWAGFRQWLLCCCGGIREGVLMGHGLMLAPGLTSVKLNSMTLEFIIPDA